MTRRLGVLLACLLWPAEASAQWYVGEAIGGNVTVPSTVSIRAGPELTLAFEAVHWSAAPLRPRRYFAVRVGYLRGPNGLEVEYLHYKAIADTSRSYRVTIGPETPLAPADVAPMEKIVETYRLDSGVNLLALLYVRRQPIGGRLAVVGKAGGGVTIPYANTTIAGATVRGYELGGPGAEAAGGLELRLWPYLYLVGDYRLTIARPSIDVAGGRAAATLLSSHGTIGLRFTFGE